MEKEAANKKREMDRINSVVWDWCELRGLIQTEIHKNRYRCVWGTHTTHTAQFTESREVMTFLTAVSTPTTEISISRHNFPLKVPWS